MTALWQRAWIFRGLIGLATVALAACVPPPEQQADGIYRISAGQTEAVRARHVDAVNALRAESGLAPVQLSARLTAAA